MAYEFNPFTGTLDKVGSSGLSIGDPISGATPNLVFFADASGNFAQDPDFIYDSVARYFAVGGATPSVQAVFGGTQYFSDSSGNLILDIGVTPGLLIVNSALSSSVVFQISDIVSGEYLLTTIPGGNSITLGDDADLGGTVGMVAINALDTTLIIRERSGQSGRLTSWQGVGLNQLVGVTVNGEIELGSTSQGVKAQGATTGVLSFTGYGNTNNEALTLDFESVANTVGIATTTGVTTVAFNSIDVTVPDEAYGVSWNGSLEVPTKNALYDKIESLSSSGSFGITIDGGGSAITTGQKGYVSVPYGMTITGWDIFADQSGSIVVDVWKDTYANFPPIAGDSIAGTEKPTLSSAQKNQDTSLSTWTTTVTAGDVIGFNVDSAATVTRVTVIIYGDRT